MSPTSSRGSNQVRRSRRRAAWPLGLALLLALASLSDANAQFLSSRRPDVVVNLHALDRFDSRQPAPRAKPRTAVAHHAVTAAKRSPSRPATAAPRSTRVADVTAAPELKSHLLQLPSLPPAGSVYAPPPPAPSVAAVPPPELPRAQPSQAAPARPAAASRPRETVRPSPAPRSQTAEAPRAARPAQPEPPPPPPPVLAEAPPAPRPPPVAEVPRAAPPPPAPPPAPSRQAAAPRTTPPAPVQVAPPPRANPAPEPPPPPPALAERAPPPPPPAPSAAPAAAAPGPQVATAPATGATRAGNRLRLLFDGTSSELSDSAKQELQQLAADLTKQSSTRIQLLAYAEGTPTTLSQARRLSLDRALTVRSYLANQGVNTTRIDVRALGNQTENGAPANRVDLMVMQE